MKEKKIYKNRKKSKFFPNFFYTPDIPSLTGSTHDDAAIGGSNAVVLSAIQQPTVRQNVLTRRVFRPSHETAGSSVTEEWLGNTVTEIGGSGSSSSSSSSNLRRQHLFTRSHRTLREQNSAVRSLNSVSSSTSHTTTMVVELNGSRSRIQSNANPMVYFHSLYFRNLIFHRP